MMIMMTTATIKIMTTPATLTCRITADVTCLAVSGELLAAGSAEMILKVGAGPYRHDHSRAITSSHILLSVQVVNTWTFSETVLEGHQGPILSVALTGQGDCVASAR